jgi:dihydrofolate reductase
MRKVTYGVASSLDGYIAGENDEVDWLLWDEEVAAISKEFWKTVDTVLMGRKTYEVALKHGTSAYPGVQNFVFSRTLNAKQGSPVQVVAEDAALFVRRMKEESGKGICVMGGGILARSLIEADLVDEIVLNVQPVLLGSGIALFPPMQGRVRLELQECRVLVNRCVLVRYEVKHVCG